jgi:hypothetical protein
VISKGTTAMPRKLHLAEQALFDALFITEYEGDTLCASLGLPLPANRYASA